MIKLVVTDIDDTLLNSKGEIPKKTKEVINKCVERGIKVILASGRPNFGMKKIVDELNLASYDNYLLSFNGAKIENIYTGEVVYEKFLSADRLKFLVDKAEKYNCDILTYKDDNVLTNSDNEYAKVERDLVDANLIIASDMKEAITSAQPKVIILKDPKYVPEIVEKLKEELGDTYEVATSKPFFIEVNDRGISKGEAIKSLAEKLNIDMNEILAIGDGLNDLSMIEVAGCGVAMGNAHEKLKEKANFVTKSNDEDGFAYAIEKFVFEK